MDIKKSYICDSCLTMNKEELVSVLNFLHREHIPKKRFCQNRDGVKIDLNTIDDSIIDRLYNFIHYKLSNKID